MQNSRKLRPTQSHVLKVMEETQMRRRFLSFWSGIVASIAAQVAWKGLLQPHWHHTDRLRQTSAAGPEAQAASSPPAPCPLKALRWPPDTLTRLSNEDPLHTSPVLDTALSLGRADSTVYPDHASTTP